MKQILFYATREDLLPILESVEADRLLKYARAGRYLQTNPQLFLSGASIPKLGTANNDSSIGCESYLILDQSADIEVRPVKQTDGTTNYHVDQLVNPDSVVITAGGIRASHVYLHGRIATASDSAQSQDLMKLFAPAFRKHFKKIKAFWVGPHALHELESGARLTPAVSSPSEFDLKP